jgi:uncharacterized peroxidase-related enzyme
MPRIAPLDPSTATGKNAESLAAVKKMLGGTPNLFTTAAQAPNVLQGLVAMFGATASGTLDGKTREAIALAVAEVNRCDYCLSAHTAISLGAGMTQAQIDQARDASSADPKTAAILRFARGVTIGRGQVTDADFQKLKNAGVTDAQALEIVANVTLNVFTNYGRHRDRLPGGQNLITSRVVLPPSITTGFSLLIPVGGLTTRSWCLPAESEMPIAGEVRPVSLPSMKI